MTPKSLLLTIGLTAAAIAEVFAQTGSGSAAQEPRFTADGQLVTPKDYRDWMFLSSGLGMTYGPVSGAGATPENPRFENVFVNRPAYEAFLKTGTWPEHTIFVLEVRSSVTRLSINKDGRVQSDITAVQAEVKDSKRFPGKWAFFNVSDDVASAKPIPANATCYTCHGANGAVDNTFVQFYPTLIRVAKEKGTFHEKAE